MTHLRPLVIATVAFVVALAAIVGVVVISSVGPGRAGKDLPPGERIFRYGLDGAGQPIPRTAA